MDQFKKKTIKVMIALLPTLLVSCGVKSKPLPPLEPPPLGSGQTKYSETAKKIKNKYNQEREKADDVDLNEQSVEEEK